MPDERWRPLSVKRNGNTEEWDAPVEGAPSWMQQSLIDWLEAGFIRDEPNRGPSRDVLSAIQRNLRIHLDWTASEYRAWDSLKETFAQTPDRLLDTIDYALAATQGADGNTLEQMLAEAGSAWAVAPDNRGLARRVIAEASQAATELVDSGSRAGALLGTAWRHIYGRHQNPGAGYREAVRAIEAVVCPCIIPGDSRGTLGKAIAALRHAPAGKYVTVFPENAIGGDPLEAVRKLMELVWTSQLDRHGTAGETVPLNVSQEQAEAALHAAITLVQWFQRGFVASVA